MKISLVVATDENGLIGKNNQLPWHMPADLKRFKEITTGHTIIMGRKTFESIGRPLPNRKNVVITRQDNYSVPEGVVVVNSLEDALELSRNEPEVFVIGGSEIFKHAYQQTDRVYLTLIHHQFEGDTWFPLPGKNDWEWTKTADFEPDEKNPFPYSYWQIDKKS